MSTDRMDTTQRAVPAVECSLTRHPAIRFNRSKDSRELRSSIPVVVSLHPDINRNRADTILSSSHPGSPISQDMHHRVLGHITILDTTKDIQDKRLTITSNHRVVEVASEQFLVPEPPVWPLVSVEPPYTMR